MNDETFLGPDKEIEPVDDGFIDAMFDFTIIASTRHCEHCLGSKDETFIQKCRHCGMYVGELCAMSCPMPGCPL